MAMSTSSSILVYSSNDHRTLLTLFQSPSTSPSRRPAVACKSRIEFTPIRIISSSKPDDQLLPDIIKKQSSFISSSDNNNKSIKVLLKRAAVTALMGTLLMYYPPSALAASSLPANSYTDQAEVLLALGVIVLVVLVVEYIFDFLNAAVSHHSAETISVMKLQLQVKLSGADSLLLEKDLNQISRVTDTSIYAGLNYMLTETTVALLRHRENCISGYSSVNVKKIFDEWEVQFKLHSVKERSKYKKTLVKVNNFWTPSSSCQRSNGVRDENIVMVTILVAAKGSHKLPSINGTTDLKKALLKLASFHHRNTMAVEIFWIPLDENDMLLEQELVKNYPLLRPL